MTREKAIELCKAIDQYLCAGNPIWDASTVHGALSMAVEALEQPEQKKGEWIAVQIGKWHGRECSCCKITREIPCTFNGDPACKYCPDCGADMQEDKPC